MPAKVADLVGSVWLQQQRVMCYGGYVHEQVQEVQTSVPQGDGMSLVAMIAILAGPMEAIRHKHRNLTMRTFVDDRCFAADSLQQAMQVKEEWKEWADVLGLRENHAKATHYHRRRKDRVSFLSAGVPPDRVTAQPKVLGVQLQALQRKISEDERKRLESVRKCIRRARFLPVAWRFKKHFIASQALCRAAWGWVFRHPSIREVQGVQSAISYALQESISACPHMRTILRGHSLDFRFRILLANLQATFRIACKSAAGCTVAWTERGWSEICRKCLAFYGWTTTQPWKWTHGELGAQFSLVAGELATKTRVEHLWRESFRQWHFRRWLSKARRDSRECAAAGTRYNEATCQIARRWAAHCRQSFMVLSGSTVSPAAFDVMKHRAVQDCCFCANSACDKDERPKATMQHLLWECVGLRDDRRNAPGDAVPVSTLQARIGWPSRPACAQDEAILGWHKVVRQKILAQRYG